MRWSEISELMKGGFEVTVDFEECKRNKYFIRKGQLHFPISSNQFDRLLEEGYIDSDYRVERGTGLWGADQMIYQGR